MSSAVSSRSWPTSRASRSSCSRCRTSPWRTASAARSSSTRWKTPTPRSWASGSPRLVDKLQALPQLRDVASDQQDAGLQAQLIIDRDTASRLGITPQMIDDALYDAFGQRQISTIFTQLNQYHVVLEVRAALPPASPRTWRRSTCAPPSGGKRAAQRPHATGGDRQRRWPSTTRGSSRSSRLVQPRARRVAGRCGWRRRQARRPSWDCPRASRRSSRARPRRSRPRWPTSRC